MIMDQVKGEICNGEAGWNKRLITGEMWGERSDVELNAAAPRAAKLKSTRIAHPMHVNHLKVTFYRGAHANRSRNISYTVNISAELGAARPTVMPQPL